MTLWNVFNIGKPKSGAPKWLWTRLVDLIKTLKNALLISFVNANSIIIFNAISGLGSVYTQPAQSYKQ